MQTLSLVLSILALALTTPLGAGGHPGTPFQDTPADVAGTWSLTVETGQGTANPSVTFTQDGERLTGTYSSQFFGEQPVTGTIKGNAITFTFSAAIEGNAITVTFSGTVEKNRMQGNVAFGEFGGGAFTGEKK